MRTENVNCATSTPKAVTAETILDSILLSGDLATMRHHLREMCDAYLLSEDDAFNRQSVHFTYSELDNILGKAEQLVSQNERRVA